MSFDRIRADFEKAMPLPPGVEYRPEHNAYCVFVGQAQNPRWMNVNGAFHVQKSFDVWLVAAKYYSPVNQEENCAENHW